MGSLLELYRHVWVYFHCDISPMFALDKNRLSRTAVPIINSCSIFTSQTWPTGLVLTYGTKWTSGHWASLHRTTEPTCWQQRSSSHSSSNFVDTYMILYDNVELAWVAVFGRSSGRIISSNQIQSSSFVGIAAIFVDHDSGRLN